MLKFWWYANHQIFLSLFEFSKKVFCLQQNVCSSDVISQNILTDKRKKEKDIVNCNNVKFNPHYPCSIPVIGKYQNTIISKLALINDLITTENHPNQRHCAPQKR